MNEKKLKINSIEDLINNRDKFIPMVTFMLQNAGYFNHQQRTKMGVVDTDNSCFASDLIMIFKAFIQVMNEEENEEVSKKFLHQ
mgnify:CR=1 FL=1